MGITTPKGEEKKQLDKIVNIPTIKIKKKGQY